jgi:hypothetical protein
MHLWTTKSVPSASPSSSVFVGRKEHSALGRSSKNTRVYLRNHDNLEFFGRKRRSAIQAFPSSAYVFKNFDKGLTCYIVITRRYNVGDMGVGRRTPFRQRVVRSTLNITICNLEEYSIIQINGRSLLFRLLFANPPNTSASPENRYLLPDSFRHFKISLSALTGFVAYFPHPLDSATKTASIFFRAHQTSQCA